MDATQQALQPPIPLSHTRLKQFEQCPMAYKLKYVDHVPATPIAHLESGIVIHRALELLMREAMAVRHVGPLHHERAQELLATAWEMETATGSGAYADASAIISKFVAGEGRVDATRVLAVEQPFTVAVGDFALNGVMDRVDRVDDETLEIVDYKTGEMIPSAEDLHSNLQLSLYQVGAQSLWPWARRVRLTLHMVRHGIKLRTTRTAQEIGQALAYVRATGARIHTVQQSGAFVARLSTSCGMCLYRLACPAYAKLVAGSPTANATLPHSLDAVAEERERMAAIAKVADARKHDLDAIIKAKLDDASELVAAGRSYFIRNTARRNYLLPETIGKVTEASGMAAGDVVNRLACINNRSLEGLLKELCEVLPKHKVDLLRAELEAEAERSYVAQLWSNPVTPAVIEGALE